MKQNIWKLSAAVVALLSVATAFAANGSGVGNGGNGARDQYLVKLKRDLAASPGVDGLDEWCGRVSSVLVRERQRAMLQYQYNRKAEAEQILIDAMTTAAQSLEVDPDVGGPMTKKLLDRTLMESQALDQVMPEEGLAQTTKLQFLFESLDFIVDVARELDPSYYIPYRYRHGGCRGGCPDEFSFENFEVQFVRMAARQLTFVTRALTETRAGRYGEVETFPLGDARGFLSVAELRTAAVAQDLRENLYAYANACVIHELESLSGVLTGYNLYGDRSVFPNARWAVSQTREQMDQVAGEIVSNSRGGCRR